MTTKLVDVGGKLYRVPISKEEKEIEEREFMAGALSGRGICVEDFIPYGRGFR